MGWLAAVVPVLMLLRGAGQLVGAAGTVAVKVVDAARFRNIRDVDQMRNELAVMQARHPPPPRHTLHRTVRLLCCVSQDDFRQFRVQHITEPQSLERRRVCRR